MVSWYITPCKSWRDPGDSGFMPHDWRTKVKIYWICSLASKWRFLRISRVWMTGCSLLSGVKSTLQTSCCMLQPPREPEKTLDSGQSLQECRKGDPSILVDAGFIKIYARFLFLLQCEARLTTHQLHHKAETQILILEQIFFMARCESVTFLRFRGWALMALKALKSLSTSNYWQ